MECVLVRPSQQNSVRGNIHVPRERGGDGCNRATHNHRTYFAPENMGTMKVCISTLYTGTSFRKVEASVSDARWMAKLRWAKSPLAAIVRFLPLYFQAAENGKAIIASNYRTAHRFLTPDPVLATCCIFTLRIRLSDGQTRGQGCISASTLLLGVAPISCMLKKWK